MSRIICGGWRLGVHPCHLSLRLRSLSTVAHGAATSKFFSPNLELTSPPLGASSSADFLPPSPHPSSRSAQNHPPPILDYPPGPLSLYKPIPALTPRRLLNVYAQLSKARLTSLVVLTAMSGVALSPLPVTVPILLATALGTTLCSASANTINQLFEVPFDAQMPRTKSRPLVRRAISPLHAALFAAGTGIAGPVILATMVNPMTAALGVANIALYAGAYTMMKRRTIWNTWVGAVVGAIPPLMGWTACGGQVFPSASHPFEFFLPSLSYLSSTPTTAPFTEMVDNPLAPLALFLFHFSWQFPHFNPLAHLTRAGYAQAGYHMLSVLDPTKNALVSLRHAVLFFPLCSILIPLSGLTTWAFALTSLVPNVIILRAAWGFWRKGTDKEARRLFQGCLWYLPVMLGLMMCHKQGMRWLEWAGLREPEERAEVDAEGRVTLPVSA